MHGASTHTATINKAQVHPETQAYADESPEAHRHKHDGRQAYAI